MTIIMIIVILLLLLLLLIMIIIMIMIVIIMIMIMITMIITILIIMIIIIKMMTMKMTMTTITATMKLSTSVINWQSNHYSAVAIGDCFYKIHVCNNCPFTFCSRSKHWENKELTETLDVLIVRWLQENLGSSVGDLFPCLSGQYCDCTTLSTGTRNVLPYFECLNFEIM